MQAPKKVAISSGSPRAATFAADGGALYVLTGGKDADPCNDSTAPAPNSIVVLAADGTLKGQWQLSGFVSNLAIDPASGRLVLSESTANRVSTLDPGQPFGNATTKSLITATCPTALRVAGGEAFVVTADRQLSTDGAQFNLDRISLTDGTYTKLAFDGPLFEETLNDGGSSPDTTVDLKIRPRSISGYEMAVTPDGSRAVFAVRARYHEGDSDQFMFIGESCMPDIDIIEYGLYTLDTGTGTASYQSRSQIVVSPSDPFNNPCVTCSLPAFGEDLTMLCLPAPGDRAAGLAAVFGDP